MTTLAASGEAVGQEPNAPGDAEIGHLSLGTGRAAETEYSRIRNAITSGEFSSNPVLTRAFQKAKEKNAGIHLVGLLSDGALHSSMDSLFALLRMAKAYGLTNVFIHPILDGLDVPERTADVYVEALEIKLADIGIGKIATLCGRFFAMDASENWERTARAFTMRRTVPGDRFRALAIAGAAFSPSWSAKYFSTAVARWMDWVPCGARVPDDASCGEGLTGDPTDRPGRR